MTYLQCLDFLPAPIGAVLTPTTEVWRVQRTWGANRDESDDNVMRRQIMFRSRITPPQELFRGVLHVQRAGEALRRLEKLGEYGGFKRAKRNQSGPG